MRPACPKLWWQRMIIWLTSHSRADTHKNLACLSPLPSPLSLFPAWPRPGAGDRNHQAGRHRDLHSHVRAAGGQGVQDVRLHHARPLRKVQVGGAGLSWRACAAVVCSCLNEARLDRRRLRVTVYLTWRLRGRRGRDASSCWRESLGCDAREILCTNCWAERGGGVAWLASLLHLGQPLTGSRRPATYSSYFCVGCSLRGQLGGSECDKRLRAQGDRVPRFSGDGEDGGRGGRRGCRTGVSRAGDGGVA